MFSGNGNGYGNTFTPKQSSGFNPTSTTFNAAGNTGNFGGTFGQPSPLSGQQSMTGQGSFGGGATANVFGGRTANPSGFGGNSNAGAFGNSAATSFATNQFQVSSTNTNASFGGAARASPNGSGSTVFGAQAAPFSLAPANTTFGTVM